MRFYEWNDMVKADCHDCRGCSECCRGMGNSILLDPFDIFNLTKNLNRSFEELLADCVELSVEDGLILPHLKMVGAEEKCAFLNEEGRCSIHGFRPGLCRTFPLGRNYEDGKLNYFLVEGECSSPNRSKVKAEKWIDVENPKQNREFLTGWHYLLKDLRAKKDMSEEEWKEMNLFFLQNFFTKPYQEKIDFYSQFDERKRIVEDRYLV